MEIKEVINLQELTVLLSSKIDIQEADSVLFLNELFELVSQRLINDGCVEIDDFGSFKINHTTLVSEEDIDSVSVGDVLSYYSLDFLPEKAFSDLINKPFINFETTKINKNAVFDGVMVFDSENAKEIVLVEETILRTITKSKPEDAVSEIVSEEVLVYGGVLEEETLANESTSDLSIDNLEVSNNDVDCTNDDVTMMNEQISEPIQQPLQDIKKHIHPSNRRKSKTKTLLMIVASGAVLLLTVSAFFLRKTISSKEAHIGNNLNVDEPPFIANSHVQPDNELLLLSDSISHSELLADENKPEQTHKTRKHDIVTLSMGKTLRQIALEKYGNKEFWIYIYLKNKSKIDNPNNVPVGVRLILPFDDEYGIDANNPSSVRKASEMGVKEMSKFD